MLHTILSNQIGHGAVIGLLGAAATDYQAFMAWKSIDDFVHYQWGTAAFRWVQGAIIGAVSAAGMGWATN